jgi:hypothetical protein
MAQTFHDDKKKTKDASDAFALGKQQQKNKDLTAAGSRTCSLTVNEENNQTNGGCSFSPQLESRIPTT